MDNNVLVPTWQFAIVRGIGHPKSNIAAVYFAGPWLNECLRLHAEINKAAGDKLCEPWQR